MLKRIFAVIKRDIKSGIRDWLYVFILLAPFLFAIVLKTLIPGVSSTTINVATDKTISVEMTEHLKKYAKVLFMGDIDAMKARILANDDIFGLIKKETGYEIIQQGNEMEGSIKILEFAINSFENKDIEIPVEVAISDVGWKMSPWKQYGAIFIILMNTVIGAMLIVMGIVEEKMSNTIAALNVSPLSKVEFVIGKSMLGVLLPIIGAVAVFSILGFDAINYGMTFVIVLATSLISMIIGFGIGLFSNEQIEAVGSLKMILLPLYGTVAGYLLLDPKWHWTFYWSPFYWAFDALDRIILETASWPLVLTNSVIIVGITAIVFGALAKKIREGLT